MNGLRGYTWLAAAALTGVGALIVLGGAVCFLGAAKAIPDWPASFGRLVPPADPGAFVEYLHRAGAVLVGLLVVALAVVGLMKFRSQPWLFVPPLLSLVLLGIVSTVGALVVLGSVPPAVAAVDLASALMVLSLMVAVVGAGSFLLRNPQGRIRLGFRGAFPKMALSAYVVLYAVLFTGLSVGNPNPANCLGLALWDKALLAAGQGLRLGYFVVSGAACVLITLVAAGAWPKRRLEKSRWLLAAGAFGLMGVSLASGEIAAAHGFPWPLMTIRVSATMLLWAALTALVVREGLKASVPGNS